MINTHCWRCKWFIGGVACWAYPDGIPSDIQNGEDDHRKPKAGDGGYQFSPKPKSALVTYFEQRDRDND